MSQLRKIARSSLERLRDRSAQFTAVLQRWSDVVMTVGVGMAGALQRRFVAA